MSVNLFALTCGRLTGELGHLMEGGEGRVDLPIPAYLIEHPKGTALFDTGMHPDCQHDPSARVGIRIAGLFSFDFRPGEEISTRLEAIDRDPAKIDIGKVFPRFFDHDRGAFCQFDRSAQDKPFRPMGSVESADKHMGKFSPATCVLLQTTAVAFAAKYKTAFFQQRVETPNYWCKRSQPEFFEFPTGSFEAIQRAQ